MRSLVVTRSRFPHPMYTRLTISTACLSLLLAACSPSPSATVGDASGKMKLPQSYENGSVPSPDISKSLLHLFKSPDLSKSVSIALQQNPSIKASASRIRQAELTLKKSKTALLPTINATSGIGRTGNSGNSSGRYNISADARWEVDVWKKIETQVTLTSSTLALQKYNHKAAQQSLAAQVMLAWTNLVQANKLIELSNQRLASFKKSYQLVDRKFENGTGNLGDLNLAKADVESTQSEIAQRSDQRDQASRRLSFLLGSYPSSKLNATTWPRLDRTVKAGAPSTLLLKRPDIQAAYQRILSADLEVTLAHKELFPTFALTSSLGQQSNILKDLASSSFNSWSILANLSSPIFDAGKRKIEIAIQQEQARELLYSYQSTVLTALQEVEDALGSESKLQQQELSTQKALNASIEAEKRVQRRYENGLIEIIDLLETQRRKFNTQERLITIKANRINNRIQLALAVGTSL